MKTLKKKKTNIAAKTATGVQDLMPAGVVDFLLECIKQGDLDSFRGAIAAHIRKENKLRFSKKTGLTRRTLYDIMNPETNFNPALTTVTALIRGVSE